MRICSSCEESKDETEYYKADSCSDGLMRRCKSCVKARVSQYRKNNSEKIKESKHRYYLNNRELVIKRAVSWNKNNRDKRKETLSKYYKRNKDRITERNHIWSKNNPEKRRVMHRRFYEKNREKRMAENKEFFERNPNYARERWLKRNYGLSLSDYTKMLADQDNRCAICGINPENETLAVDHDHSTGRVRGLLCRKCNVGLGMLEPYLDKAKEYLLKERKDEA